jgi:fructosamine-3-kinase
MSLTQINNFNDPEFIITGLIADAIDQKKLPPQACDIISYSQHLNNDLQQQYMVKTAGGDYFLKRQPDAASSIAQYEAESSGLLTIMASHSIAAALPYATGSVRNHSYIIISHIPLAVHGDWADAGRQIAAMHNWHSVQGYGFERSTYCGATAMNNKWNKSWADFYTDKRIRPMIEALEEKGELFADHERALDRCRARLAGHQPEASLLHGDLWSGNIGFLPINGQSKPVVFDPACYFGDAETDLAMTELFGRFPEAFYQGYNVIRPISPDYEERREIYQLFHLLNHALLFGGHYVNQSREVLKRL